MYFNAFHFIKNNFVFTSFSNLNKKTTYINTFAPGLIQVVRAKTARLHVALLGNFSGPVNATDPVKSSKDSPSLIVCNEKKMFWLGATDSL